MTLHAIRISRVAEVACHLLDMSVSFCECSPGLRMRKGCSRSSCTASSDLVHADTCSQHPHPQLPSVFRTPGQAHLRHLATPRCREKHHLQTSSSSYVLLMPSVA